MLPCLDISYRSLEHVIVARWMGQTLSDEDFQASYHYLLETAVRHDCRYWLLDVRRSPPCCTRQATWLLQEFCPRLVAALHPQEPFYGAYLVFPSHLPHYTNIVLPILDCNTNTCYQVAAFLDEGLTTRWLRRQQARL
ncbi:MAG: hypothetical protein ACRYFZ_14425 [Janthinobacterium lividum]